VPFDKHGISWQERRNRDRTHTYIESLKPIASSRPEGENFWASVSNTDLEVAISVFLFKDKAYGLLDIYKESAWGGLALLVVGHSSWLDVPVVLECGTFGTITRRLERDEDNAKSIKGEHLRCYMF
jgi:hypothetical protein